MNTTIQHSTGRITYPEMAKAAKAGTKAAEASKSVKAFWEKAEFNRYGITPMLLITVACISGGAAAMVYDKSALLLSTVVSFTMAVEVLVLAVAPMKWITWASILAVAVDFAVFISAMF